MSEPVTIHVGDVREGLAKIPAGSVQCCVTSPPYWGLRDYGVEGQIGLEPTPEAFIAKMVEVFAGVRRVLRNDGTLWLNMGSSYAAGGTDPSQSLRRLRARPCDTDGKEPQGSPVTGRACPCCGGELLDGSQIRRDYIARTSQQPEQSAPPHLPTSRDIARLGCEKASPRPSSRAAGKSTTRASFRRDRAAVVPAGKALVSPSTQPTSALCGPASVHTSACTFDSATSVRPLGVGTLGTGLFCMACGYCTKAYPAFKPKDLINMPMMVIS